MAVGPNGRASKTDRRRPVVRERRAAGSGRLREVAEKRRRDRGDGERRVVRDESTIRRRIRDATRRRDARAARADNPTARRLHLRTRDRRKYEIPPTAAATRNVISRVSRTDRLFIDDGDADYNGACLPSLTVRAIPASRK